MNESRASKGSGSRVVDLARRPQELTDLDPTTQRHDPIRTFLPCRPESEYRLRHRIDRAGLMASAGATRTMHDGARSICWAAADLANSWRLRSASENQLIAVVHALAIMLAAARAVERTEVGP